MRHRRGTVRVCDFPGRPRASTQSGGSDGDEFPAKLETPEMARAGAKQGKVRVDLKKVNPRNTRIYAKNEDPGEGCVCLTGVGTPEEVFAIAGMSILSP